MIQQQILNLDTIPKQDFDSFVPCAGNRTAVEFARRCANINDPEKLLYLYGPPGCGKTHLLNAIGKQVANNDYRIFNCAQMQAEDADILLDEMAEQPVLLIDNLDKLPADDRLRHTLWEAFNWQYNAGKPLALTGQIAPRELGNLDEHLITRLLWGLVAFMDISDDQARLQLILKIANDLQVVVPNDVANWLLTILPRDSEALQAGCKELYYEALKTKRKISLKLARELFLAKSDHRLQVEQNQG